MTKEIRIKIYDNGYEVTIFHSISFYTYVFEDYKKMMGFVEWCNEHKHLQPPLFFN